MFSYSSFSIGKLMLNWECFDRLDCRSRGPTSLPLQYRIEKFCS